MFGGARLGGFDVGAGRVDGNAALEEAVEVDCGRANGQVEVGGGAVGIDAADDNQRIIRGDETLRAGVTHDADGAGIAGAGDDSDTRIPGFDQKGNQPVGVPRTGNVVGRSVMSGNMVIVSNPQLKWEDYRIGQWLVGALKRKFQY